MARSVSRTCRTVNSVHRWSTSQLTMRQTCAKHAPNSQAFSAGSGCKLTSFGASPILPLRLQQLPTCSQSTHVHHSNSVQPKVLIVSHDSWLILFMLSSCSLHALFMLFMSWSPSPALGTSSRSIPTKYIPSFASSAWPEIPTWQSRGLDGLGLGARSGYVSRIGVHWRLWRTWAWCGCVHLDWRFGHQSLCAQNESCATWKNVQCLTRNQHLRACSILLHLLLLQVNFVNCSVLKLSSALLFGDAALRALPRAEPHQVPQNRQRLSFWSIWSIWSSWSCSVGMLQNRLMEPNWPT